MLDRFREIWCIDFEFVAPPGERPDPVCCCARELRSGRRVRLWRDAFGKLPPYCIGPDSLVVAFYSSAEMGCHLALGWPMPARLLDLFAEFRVATNGVVAAAGNSLLGALTHYGLDHMGAVEKRAMVDLVLRGDWSADEREAVLDYCSEDVDALARLLPAMLPSIDVPRALLRGRYMKAAAHMEHTGVPIDAPRLALLREHWDALKDSIIADIDRDYGVFDGRTFKIDWFGKLLCRLGIPWPRLESGNLDLSDATFRQMAKAHPVLSPLRELRSALSDLRLNALAVGRDGRNRTLLSAFRARTGRNQPSNSRFIFGPSVWLRGLIKPPPGHAVAYIDWSQQEFGIAAALSGDRAMQSAYLSGDPYLAFAKQAGAVPSDATKASHGPTRELFKACVLATQYGMEAPSLALRIGRPEIVARDLLRAHRETYRTFWRWSNAAVDHAMLRGSLWTVFGWAIHITAGANVRSLRNFPMQANGAEMLRLACVLGTERGVPIAAPVHDAVLIVCRLERLTADIAAMQEAMAEASRLILDGFELRSDVSIVRYPSRYADPRGAVMWQRVMKLIADREGRALAA